MTAQEQLALVGKTATVRATGEAVYIRYANCEGGVYVHFAAGGARTWFRITDLEIDNG